jgi:uncharacterized protein YcbX
MDTQPYLARIIVYPFKGLDGVELSSSRITSKGSLEYDREFALVDEEGNVVSCKREKKLHRIRLKADLRRESFTFTWGEESYSFGFDELENISAFFSEILGYRVYAKRFPDGGMPDDRKAHGPTLVSRSTLAEVAGWFGFREKEVRRRFRSNLELEGVPPFWEDRLVGEDTYREFKIGDVLFRGFGISKRCPVPTRNSITGEETKGFVKHFIYMREKLLPDWAPRGRFSDTYYRLCVNTELPSSEVGKELRVGDRVNLL